MILSNRKFQTEIKKPQKRLKILEVWVIAVPEHCGCPLCRGWGGVVAHRSAESLGLRLCLSPSCSAGNKAHVMHTLSFCPLFSPQREGPKMLAKSGVCLRPGNTNLPWINEEPLDAQSLSSRIRHLGKAWKAFQTNSHFQEIIAALTQNPTHGCSYPEFCLIDNCFLESSKAMSASTSASQ